MRIIFVKSVNIRIKFQNLGGILGIGDIGIPLSSPLKKTGN